MQELPPSLELSCLPMFVDENPKVELSLSATDLEEVEKYFNLFVNELTYKNISYKLIQEDVLKTVQ